MKEAIDLMEKDGRTKIVRCECGDKCFMACRMPLAETERDTIREFAKYARQGFKIDIVPNKEVKFCAGIRCEKSSRYKPILQTSLF